MGRELMFINKKMSIEFMPLGGSGEIGMNLNLYKYSKKWLIVDCGISFFKDLGIKTVTPDPRYIIKYRKNLVGLIITHAHEDHIGAISLLWSKLLCPIYATPFTAEIIKRKLKNSGLAKQIKINIIPI